MVLALEVWAAPEEVRVRVRVPVPARAQALAVQLLVVFLP